VTTFQTVGLIVSWLALGALCVIVFGALTMLGRDIEVDRKAEEEKDGSGE